MDTQRKNDCAMDRSDSAEMKIIRLMPITTDSVDGLVDILSRVHPHIFGKTKDRKRILDFMTRMAITFDHVREQTEQTQQTRQ